MIIMSFLFISGCSSQSSNTCLSSQALLEFNWVCGSDYSNSNNLNNDQLTYDGKSICLVQPPLLTTQSFVAIIDKSDDGMLAAELTLSDEAAKALREHTSMEKGKQLATVLKSSSKPKRSGFLTESSCKNETTILNIATIQTELGSKLLITGWQSHQQIQQLMARINKVFK